jgi:hypothetical protein
MSKEYETAMHSLGDKEQVLNRKSETLHLLQKQVRGNERNAANALSHLLI